MFLHEGTYYLYVSGTMGWAPTTMYVYSASEPLGNFSASNQDEHYWVRRWSYLAPLALSVWVCMSLSVSLSHPPTLHSLTRSIPNTIPARLHKGALREQ